VAEVLEREARGLGPPEWRTSGKAQKKGAVRQDVTM
jgi:hypothetical protein